MMGKASKKGVERPSQLPKGFGNSTRRFRKLRTEFHEHCREIQAPCWICGQPIDYRYEWPDDNAFELDHLYPQSTHPELAEDPANFRPSHRLCNRTRSNSMQIRSLNNTTRQWLKS